jgi:hypothetical protein
VQVGGDSVLYRDGFVWHHDRGRREYLVDRFLSGLSDRSAITFSATT